MSPIPRDPQLDTTLALLTEGYHFIGNRCQRYGSDLFETRLMLRRVICMSGSEAAAVFYYPDRFTRQGAMPPTTVRLLQDKGSVQLLDGPAHRRRKELFLGLMSAAAMERLADLMAEQWQAQLGAWEAKDRIVLLPEVRQILCRAVCAWAGVPLNEAEARQRTRELGAMIDGAGAVGPRMIQALILRARTERWAREIIAQVRSGRLAVPDGSAVHVIAAFRDHDGALLDTEVAAVELINIFRPTVAVAQFIVFCALALHEYPTYRPKLQVGNEGELECFVQEVRRFYPFFPFVGGRARSAFEWRGHHFTPGAWVLLDLYGTNHDARVWTEPEAFLPGRFRHWAGDAFALIPQGGGDSATTHRCPGEGITITFMKRAVHLLTTAMTYEVPAQDLAVDSARMPAIPRSQFVIAKVRSLR